MRYVDLSHVFIDDMPVFPGDPQVSLRQIASIPKEGFTDHQLSTGMHVGTHIDAPLHMIEGGKYISDVSVDCFAGPGILLDVRGKKEIDAAVLSGIILPQDSIVFLCTGKSSIYGTEQYNNDYPRITESFASSIAEKGIKIIGMDMLNPDTDETYPVHKIFLSQDILIIENLTNLEMLLNEKDFEVFAFPIKLRADASPVRVVARVK